MTNESVSKQPPVHHAPATVLDYSSSTPKTPDEITKIIRLQKILMGVIIAYIGSHISLFFYPQLMLGLSPACQIVCVLFFLAAHLTIFTVQIGVLIKLMLAMKINIIVITLVVIGSLIFCVGLLFLLSIDKLATIHLRKLGYNIETLSDQATDIPHEQT